MATFELARSKATIALPVCAPSSARIAELDGLRGAAVLAVVSWHYVGQLQGAWTIPFHLGWSGVDLFFVLSGFLIGGILLDNRHRGSYFRAFYGRRVHRIFPLYYFWLAIVLLCRLPCFEPKWTYAVFVQNLFQGTRTTWDSPFLGATWSLAIEEQFYIFAPLLIRFLRLRTLLWVGLALVAGGPVCRALMPADWPLAAYLMTPCRADALAMGAISAGLIRKSEVLHYIRQNTGRLRALTGTAGLLLVYLLFRFESFKTMSPIWYSVIALFYSCVIVLSVVSPPVLLSRSLRHPWLQRAGTLSFAIYIFHMPVYAFHTALIPNYTIAVLSACVVTYLLSELSGEFLEGPLLRRGHRKYPYA
jgi:peptidoglycan/LPS O-acetylase OafA/YrhL